MIVMCRRCFHEAVLRRVLSTTLNKQAFSAITLRAAWVLEEVFMRGAPVNISDLNGFTPLHIAVQNNDFECMMVLFNIGVDYNAETLSGVTPLFLGTLEYNFFLLITFRYLMFYICIPVFSMCSSGSWVYSSRETSS